MRPSDGLIELKEGCSYLHSISSVLTLLAQEETTAYNNLKHTELHKHHSIIECQRATVVSRQHQNSCYQG